MPSLSLLEDQALGSILLVQFEKHLSSPAATDVFEETNYEPCLWST
jgi:hypothetical protein